MTDYTAHDELVARVWRATELEQCTPHAGRAEHADPAVSPPPPAVALWVGQNGHASLLCRSCLLSWMDNALEDPALYPTELTVFLWRRR